MKKYSEIVEFFDSELQDVFKRQQLWSRIKKYMDAVFEKWWEGLERKTEIKKILLSRSKFRLIKRQKEFIESLFVTNDLKNLEYSIEKIAQLHLRKGIDPAYLGWGFSELAGFLYEVSLQEKFSYEEFKLLQDLLKIIELGILSGYCESFCKDVAGKQSMLDDINVVFKNLRIHEEAVKVVKKLWEFEDKKEFLQYLKAQNVPLEPANCPLLSNLDSLERLSYLGIDVRFIEKEKLNWFEKLNSIVKCIEEGDEQGLREVYEQFMTSSRKITDHLSLPLREIITMMCLIVNSGMKLFKKSAEIIMKKEIESEEVFEVIQKEIESVLKEVLGWAIEKIEILPEEKDGYDLVERINLEREKDIIIGLKFIEGLYKDYLKEITELFIEIVKLLVFLKQREFELIELADKAEAANRAKDMFLASMSHELRTPLNAIIGFAQILQMRKDIPDHIKPYIEKIYVAGKNLLDLVNTILDFAKLEAGKIEIHLTNTNIKELLNEVQTLVAPALREKKLSFSYPEFSSFMLYVDPKLIKEVFLNLISNAIKFTPEGGKIWIDIKFSKEEKAYVFSVCDTGIGIKKEDIPKLFNPFTQLDNPFQKTAKGTGLGLAITKKIVELHKGKIWVESEYGKGTCFHFTIPVSQEAEIFETIEAKQPDAPKILIVEDLEHDMEILKECLKNEFTLLLTNFLQRGLNLLKNEKIDLIILDYFLADGVGTDILDYLEEQSSEIPVILISAESKVKEILKDHPYKNVRFLIKSGIKCEEIKNLVSESLFKKELEK